MSIVRQGSACVFLLWIGIGESLTGAAEPESGYQTNVRVKTSGTIDAVFPRLKQSPKQSPADWNPDYEASEQRFALYAPPEAERKHNVQPEKKNAGSGYPLVLFISLDENPQGWPQLENLCRKEGVIYASAYDAGLRGGPARQVQIVLDVLQQLRESYFVDPQRTYLAGFSFGTIIAQEIVYALPEYFGGVVAISEATSPRQESWLRERARGRLSVAFVTGESGHNRPVIERWKGQLTAEVGIRSRVWVVSKLGHEIPKDQTLSKVYAWLEAGLESRRKYAQQWPASVADPVNVLDREAQADALLTEAQERLKDLRTRYSGLMQLKGLDKRWGDLPAAKTARKLIRDYEAREPRPWEEEAKAEWRLHRIVEARGMTDYVLGPLPETIARHEIKSLAT